MTGFTPPLLSLRDLHKSYAVPVLKAVSLDLRAGEVHALLGANGAGKTTLARILCGLTRADSGDMMLAGAPYTPTDKAGAEQAGVRIVHQELNLIDTLSVAENLFFGDFPGRLGWIDGERLRDGAREALRVMGLDEVDPDTSAGRLGVGQKQLVEIAAALRRSCRVLILDEPTAALTDPQIERLFHHVRRLRAAGVGILYISHRMEELRRIADRATILRDGKVITTADMRDLTMPRIIADMVGPAGYRKARRGRRDPGRPALRVQGLRRGQAVRGIDLHVRRGEIYGLAGLVGSGRTELLRAIFGADRADAGSVTVGDAPPRRFRHPGEAVTAGLAMIPEDRKQQGLLLAQSIKHNTSLGVLHRLAGPLGWIDRDRETAVAERIRRDLDLQCRDLDQAALELSGGNQQKVLIGRWLVRDAEVFLFDEPTRGIDVTARARVHQLLHDLAEAGKAVLMVSSELEELMDLCDRIGVLSNGRLTAEFERGAWSQRALLAAAFAGYQPPEETPASTRSRTQ